MIYNIKADDHNYRLDLRREGETWKCELDGRTISLDVRAIVPNIISLIVEGKSYEIHCDRFRDQTRVWIDGRAHTVEVSDPRSLRSSSPGSRPGGGSRLIASMPGKVLRVLVNEMEEVAAGQSLMVVEAMKMQNEIKSLSRGIVKQLVSEGTQVNAGDVLAVVE